MSAAKLTPWFPGNVRPKHEAWYERRMRHGGVAYWYWNLRFWCHGGFADLDHSYISGRDSAEQRLPWRGLAEKP